MKFFGFRLAIALGALVATLVVIEVILRLGGCLSEAREVFESDSVVAVEEAADWRPGRRLHPYRGWMDTQGLRASFVTKDKPFFPDGKPTAWALRNSTTNRFGYLSGIEDYRKVSKDDFVVGIFGGSVASQLCLMAGETIEQAVKEGLSGHRGNVVVLNCASRGYKQPQTLFALSELALLGVPFDVVVNVDGLNEVVFGGRDARDGLHPFFPSRMQYRTILELQSGAPSAAVIMASAKILSHQVSARKLKARLAGSSAMKNLEIIKAVVGTMVMRHERIATQIEAGLQEEADREGAGDWMRSLDDPRLGPDGEYWELIADIWARGSRLMAAESRAVGARYIHVLQPNQHVPGSKTLTETEAEMAMRSKRVYREPVRRGYPFLQQQGHDLKSEGIDFVDLTRLFVETDEDIYVDSCCHYNYMGCQIVGDAVAALIVGSPQ